jgi:hypothetical protein
MSNPVRKPFDHPYDQVMKEGWEAAGNDAQGREAGLYSNGRLVWPLDIGDSIARIQIAALGKTALSLMEELEWMDVCPVCAGVRDAHVLRSLAQGHGRVLGHTDDCKLGALCNKIRFLKSNDGPGASIKG